MSEADKIQIAGKHYDSVGIQHWTFTWEYGYNQFEYCISKYVLRYKDKNGLQDLEKARHYLDKYIELVGAELVIPNRLAYQMSALFESYHVDKRQELILSALHIGELSTVSLYLNFAIQALSND
jgi:hypothetical protein